MFTILLVWEEKYLSFNKKNSIVSIYPESDYYKYEILKENLYAKYSIATCQRPLRSPWYDLLKIWNPTYFQGNRANKNYFEGWYFKNVSADGNTTWSFIPGIAIAENNTHAFVQAINGKTGETYYFSFKPDVFRFSKHGFEVYVAENYFSPTKCVLNLKNEQCALRGELEYGNLHPYRAGFVRPGIMGWYRYVPFMECYHGLVSMCHTVRGTIHHNAELLNFDDGLGYIEKDWGSSMPKAWIWMQTNNFEMSETSFMLSVARIPWIGKTFTGFLGFLMYQGKTITFATYTGAKISKLEKSDNRINIAIHTSRLKIFVNGHSKNSGELKAPLAGEMSRMIHESIDAELQIVVENQTGESVFSGTGRNAGLELVGDINLLKP